MYFEALLLDVIKDTPFWLVKTQTSSRPMRALEIGLQLPSHYINSYNVPDTVFINQCRLGYAVITSNS